MNAPNLELVVENRDDYKYDEDQRDEREVEPLPAPPPSLQHHGYAHGSREGGIRSTKT